MSPIFQYTLKTTLFLALACVNLQAAERSASPNAPTTLPAAAPAATAANGPAAHLIQFFGPQASPKSFMDDLNLYSNKWPFFEGRSVEFKGKFVFQKKVLTDAQFSADLARLKDFSSPTLRRNYVRILCSAQYTEGNRSATWDLWNDADRDTAVANFATLARQARLVGFQGVFIDPEPYSNYGYNPWQYSSHKAPSWSQNASGAWVNAHSFAETQARMQDLGARIMEAIESDSPKTRVLLAHGLGLAISLCYDTAGKPVTAVDSTAWSNHVYGLWTSFIGGLASKVYMTRIVDMQENVGYWASSEADFKAGTSFLYDLGPALLLPQSLWVRYRSYIEWGNVLFNDALFRLTEDRRFLSGWMLVDERPVFAETMLYWAFRNSSARGGADIEVMIYAETDHWGTTWSGTAVTYPYPNSIPAAYANGLSDFRRGVPPPDVSGIVARAWERKRAGQWPSD